MVRVFILNSQFYKPDRIRIRGGVQVYIKMLADVIKKLEHEPVIMQYANEDFEEAFNGTPVYGIKMKPFWSKRKKNKALFTACMKQFDPEKDILVFTSEKMAVKNRLKRVICIQHGIYWDLVNKKQYSDIKSFLFLFLKALRSYKKIKSIKYAKKLVCVDYNFINWYRTQALGIPNDIRVIPNCTEIAPPQEKPTGSINIIYARNLRKYRGTRLFAAAVKQLIQKYHNIHITFAGNGADESYLKALFKDDECVDFTDYDSEDSLAVHQKYHIAVIPSLGSEGTSLSLLEAMSSQCAVIVTNVGGMMNIVLDNFNGLIASPEEKSLTAALERLINDAALRERLSENAYHTVSQAFNKDLWEARWIEVFREI